MTRFSLTISAILLLKIALAVYSDDGLKSSIVSKISNNKLSTRFAQFVSRHGKIYETDEEMKVRFSIFSENYRRIKMHNLEGLSYTLAVNKFTDLTWEEFRTQKLAARNSALLNANGKPISKALNSSYKLKSHALPTTKDWRKEGIVGPVKNQGGCASCWSFITTGSLEAAYAQSHGKNISLSEQQLVDCSWDFGNVGCDGGWPPQTFDYIKSVGGLETENSYPYTATNRTCKFCSKRVSPVKLVDYVNIPMGAEDELKHAVGLVRPVTVVFQVVDGFQSYKSGVYTSKTCNTTITDVNHGALAVGYGVEKDGLPYWIMKNSWGAEWGDNGYFKMEMGKNMCGVAVGALYPVIA